MFFLVELIDPIHVCVWLGVGKLESSPCDWGESVGGGPACVQYYIVSLGEAIGKNVCKTTLVEMFNEGFFYSSRALVCHPYGPKFTVTLQIKTQSFRQAILIYRKTKLIDALGTENMICCLPIHRCELQHRVLGAFPVNKNYRAYNSGGIRIQDLCHRADVFPLDHRDFLAARWSPNNNTDFCQKTCMC